MRLLLSSSDHNLSGNYFIYVCFHLSSWFLANLDTYCRSLSSEALEWHSAICPHNLATDLISSNHPFGRNDDDDILTGTPISACTTPARISTHGLTAAEELEELPGSEDPVFEDQESTEEQKHQPVQQPTTEDHHPTTRKRSRPAEDAAENHVHQPERNATNKKPVGGSGRPSRSVNLAYNNNKP